MPISAVDTPRFERLIREMAIGSRLIRAWGLTGGISATMTALEVEQPDSQTRMVIVRQPSARTLQHNPRAAEDEFRLLQLTHALGLATPAPLRLDSSGAIFPSPYLVIEYIDGRPDYAPSNPPDAARQMAEHLAALHRVDCATPDWSFLPAQANDLPSLIGPPPAQPNESMDETRIREELERAWPWRQRNAPALLHGDYWPGNVLWRAGRLVAVVDWEDARCGDPLMDLAISRLDLLWIYGRAAFDAFTSHYQSTTRIDESNLPYWDLCAALRLVRLAGSDLAGWAAFFAPYGRADITEQTIREHYRFFVDQALRTTSSVSECR